MMTVGRLAALLDRHLPSWGEDVGAEPTKCECGWVWNDPQYSWSEHLALVILSEFGIEP